jgi:hypothetical protein
MGARAGSNERREIILIRLFGAVLALNALICAVSTVLIESRRREIQ